MRILAKSIFERSLQRVRISEKEKYVYLVYYSVKKAYEIVYEFL